MYEQSIFDIKANKTPEECHEQWKMLLQKRPEYPYGVAEPEMIWPLAVTQEQVYNDILQFRGEFLGVSDFREEWFRVKNRKEWKWDIQGDSFLNTLSYIWWTRSGGCWVALNEHGQVERLVLLKNINYVNDWPNMTIKEFKKAYHREKYEKLLPDVRKWSAAGCLIGNENPIRIRGIGYSAYLNFFGEVAKKYKKRVDFFFHRSDHPVASWLGYEPFYHYTGSFMTKIRGVPSGKILNWYRILANGWGKLYVERPIPTLDEWQLVTQAYFPPSCENSYINSIAGIPWEARESRAVWRGGLTNCGFDEKHNIRLRLVFMGKDKSDLMNVGITGWGGRMKAEFHPGRAPKISKTPVGYLRKKRGINLAEKMSRDEQQHYKYIIDIPGNNENPAYRIAWEMLAGFVILFVGDSIVSKNGEGLRRLNLWFYGELEAWKHYVPVSWDLSDLDERIRWCQTHDLEAKKIAENAQKLGKKLFTKKRMIEQVVNMLKD